MFYQFYYGSDETKIDITDKVNKMDFIPQGDQERADIFGDPCPCVLKFIYIEKEDKTVMKYSSNVSIKINKLSIETKLLVKSAVVSVAKFESDYIIDFVNYHLMLGFDKIFIYDNEDVPTYQNLINNEKVIITHMPRNNHYKAVQYVALEHFINNYINQFTHVAHIDVDEYIVLKKHKNINDFISEYITGDCAGIAMNWRFFGSNGQTHKTDVSDIVRFTKCELKGNKHVKTIFDVSCYAGWNSPHSIATKPGKFVKATNGVIVDSPFNETIDFSVIQCNHYKCKTLPEFKYIRTRGRADLLRQPHENVEENFKMYDLNEIEDYSALVFYSKNLTNFLNNLGFQSFEGYCEQVPEQLSDLLSIIKDAKTILEIGFNAGHSSNLFLENSSANVVSFDINEHDYTIYGKKYIDHKFPNRHTLITGDSTITVANYYSKFDVLFIDGGHSYDIARADILNCEKLAKKGSIVILDDTMFKPGWVHHFNEGPTRAWKEFVESGKIKEIKKVDYQPGRGMSWGIYVNNF